MYNYTGNSQIRDSQRLIFVDLSLDYNQEMDKTKIAIKIFDEYAQAYHDKFMDDNSYSGSLDLFLNLIKKKNARLLELACGPGNITRYLLRKNPDLKILATDLSPKMLDLARQNNPLARFELMDCRDINKLKESYDGIICGFGLPYISKPESLELINNSAKLLQSDGILYLSTMEGDHSNSGWKGPSSGGNQKMYIHYHQADYLKTALGAAGLQLQHLIRLKTENDENSPNDVVLIAQIYY